MSDDFDQELQIWYHTAGDSLTPLGRTLTQNDVAINGTGKTLQARLVRDDGEVIHNWQTDGAEWSDAAAGKAQYTWPAAATAAFDAQTAETIYWLRFGVVGAGSKRDSYPHDGQRLKLVVRPAT